MISLSNRVPGERGLAGSPLRHRSTRGRDASDGADRRGAGASPGR